MKRKDNNNEMVCGPSRPGESSACSLGRPVSCLPLPSDKRSAGPRELSFVLREDWNWANFFLRTDGPKTSDHGPYWQVFYRSSADATLPQRRPSSGHGARARSNQPKNGTDHRSTHSTARRRMQRPPRAGPLERRSTTRLAGGWGPRLDIDSDAWWPAGRTLGVPNLLGGAVNRHVLNAADLAAYYEYYYALGPLLFHSWMLCVASLKIWGPDFPRSYLLPSIRRGRDGKLGSCTHLEPYDESPGCCLNPRPRHLLCSARSLASPELGRAGRRPALFIGRRLRYGPPVHSLLTAHLQYSHGGDACCCLVLQHHRERISFQKFRLLTWDRRPLWHCLCETN